MAFEPAQHSFITLEGVDGAGKSTQARLLARALELAGYQVVSLREPGGTAISEKIRALLLDPANTAMGDTCELLLYEAARAQLVHEVIAPALAAGKMARHGDDAAPFAFIHPEIQEPADRLAVHPPQHRHGERLPRALAPDRQFSHLHVLQASFFCR